jgi:thiosulfate/3-mercaptopyruvate sulfurtransferase
MKTNRIIIGLLAIAAVITGFNCAENTSGEEPWKPNQLMEPSVLAAKLASKDAHPVVINIGPSGLIAEAIDIGPGQEAANITRMKAELGKISKDKEVVIYCGCCPFKNCPNIRPAFTALKEAGFEKAFLLNLSENLRVDWIAKGYPMATSTGR